MLARLFRATQESTVDKRFIFGRQAGKGELRMSDLEKLQDKAMRYFCERPKNFPEGRPFNCCESVLMALKDIIGIEADLIPRIGTGIGAGVSLNGLLCGSVSSIALAAGMKFGRSSPEENPQPVWDLVDRYVADFKDKFRYLNCRELTGLDVKTKEGQKEYFAKIHDYACADRIRFAVRKGAEILSK
jgi:C_GCAxxG_C_C family probable redox protein